MKRLPRLAALGGLLTLAGLILGTGALPVSADTGGISGTVFSSKGVRLAKAQVTVFAPVALYKGRCWDQTGDQPYDPGWHPLASSSTDRYGAFAVGGLADGVYRLEVVPPKLTTDAYGYYLNSYQYDGTPDGANVTPWAMNATDIQVWGGRIANSVDVHLALPASISGVVKDATSGAPLAGIEVRATRYQYLADYRSTLTDRRGHYVLNGLPRSAGSTADLQYGLVTVDPKGRHSDFIWWHHPDPNGSGPTLDASTQTAVTKDVGLDAATPMVVHAQDATSGDPVAGALVVLSSAFPIPYRVTDSAGNATVALWDDFSGFTAGVIDLDGDHAVTYWGDKPNVNQATTFASWNGTDPAIIHLGQGFTVTGHVVYSQGDGALWGVTAFPQSDLPPDPNQQYYFQIGTGMVNTACDGTFEIRGLPQTDFRLWIQPPEDWTRYQDFSAPAATFEDLGDIDYDSLPIA